MSDVKTKRLKLKDLIPDTENPNAHTERGMALIAKSLETVGLGRSIVTDKHGNILAGNGVTEVAIEQGFDGAVEIETDGTTLVIVKRIDLDLTNDPEHRARMYTYLDNQAARASINFLPAQVIAHMKAGVPLNEVFTAEEMQALVQQGVNEQAQDTEAPDAQPDRADELQQKWQCQRGQIWTIGKCRLMCGDCTSAEDVARLMAGGKYGMVFTDPLYGVNYDSTATGRSKRQFDKIENDDLTGDAFQNFNVVWLGAVIPFAVKNASFYVCGANRTAHHLIMAAERLNLHYAVPLVWVKQHFSLSWDRYHPQHEYIFYGGEGSKPTGGKSRWYGPKNETTVWQIDRDHSGDYEHPTQKPVELPARAIRNSSVPDEIVADFFCGSGTTLVACEQLKRRGYGMEISEKYCAVALERLSLMGLTPILENS